MFPNSRCKILTFSFLFCLSRIKFTYIYVTNSEHISLVVAATHLCAHLHKRFRIGGGYRFVSLIFHRIPNSSRFLLAIIRISIFVHIVVCSHLEKKRTNYDVISVVSGTQYTHGKVNACGNRSIEMKTNTWKNR